MNIIKINDHKYELIEGQEQDINKEELSEKITEYFDNYDYIFGDYSYDKVRLKGYNDSKNKKVNKINDIKNLKEYKRDFCSYGARTFLLKKVK